MNLFSSTLLFSMLISISSFAALITLEPGGQNLNGVNISAGANTQLEQQNVHLTTIGAGLRAKKVLVTKVKVYVAELMASEPQNFQKNPDQALASLKKIRSVVLRMNFLRTVEAEKVQVSFREALVANNVDLNSADMVQFLKAVNEGGDALDGKALTLLMNKNADGSETLFYEDSLGKITAIPGAAGLTEKVMSIWLGVPADDGIQSLKEQLLK